MKATRIFLFPGFGGTYAEFDSLLPYFDHLTSVGIDYNPFLQGEPTFGFKRDKLVNKIIDHYQITENDLLIGHSMGGFISHMISQKTEAKVCQIASFTNPERVMRIIKKNWATVWFIRLGGLRLRTTEKYLLKRRRKKPSHDIMKIWFQTQREAYTNKQLAQLVQTMSYPLDFVAEPSLRIHSKKDRIVLPPKEDYVEVPGDHFNLILHPEIVGPIVADWIKRHT